MCNQNFFNKWRIFKFKTPKAFLLEIVNTKKKNINVFIGFLHYYNIIYYLKTSLLILVKINLSIVTRL